MPETTDTPDTTPITRLSPPWAEHAAKIRALLGRDPAVAIDYDDDARAVTLRGQPYPRGGAPRRRPRHQYPDRLAIIHESRIATVRQLNGGRCWKVSSRWESASATKNFEETEKRISASPMKDR